MREKQKEEFNLKRAKELHREIPHTKFSPRPNNNKKARANVQQTTTATLLSTAFLPAPFSISFHYIYFVL